MTSKQLDNLVKAGNLKKEPPDQQEFKGLVESAKKRFKDAKIQSLSIESRFDLGYNAAHALALAALRWHGFRSENRYLVFQCLPHTLELGPEVWRVLAKCHEQRNRAEYQGHVEIDEQLVDDLIQATEKVLEKINALAPIK
jgi:uncharacterized protein (UPF0332 family)